VGEIKGLFIATLSERASSGRLNSGREGGKRGERGKGKGTQQTGKKVALCSDVTRTGALVRERKSR